ncbi:MAG TPA: hypothetical protein DCP63_07140 [Bacteroidetes bacterium]|nr:hypothetical protein [Bacteroidota bacterium]
MNQKLILALQIASLGAIWILVTFVGIWILNLLQLSNDLRDVPDATLAISIIAVPVFVTIAGVLTYVFVGLQKGKRST